MSESGDARLADQGHAEKSASASATRVAAPGWRRYLLPALEILLIAVMVYLRMYRSPHNASDLDIVPDAVEAVVGADRIIHHHSFDITFNGNVYPSRYLPWFSLIFLAPLQALVPGVPGIGIWMILATSLVVLWGAYGVAREFGGPGAGVLVLLLLMFNSEFANSARRIQNDMPAAACGILMLLVFVKSREQLRWKSIVLVGTLGLLAGALRTTSLLLFIPFFWVLRRAVHPYRKILVLALFPAAVVAANAWYNYATFGDAFRTGYSYWCAVPYDYFSLTFNFAYMIPNLVVLAKAFSFGLPVCAAIVMMVVHSRSDKSTSLSPMLMFVLLSAAPVSAAYILYFYPGVRFHLLLIVCASVIAAAVMGQLGKATLLHHPAFAIYTLMLGMLISYSSGPIVGPASRYDLIKTYDAVLPANAVLISTNDPVYLNFLWQKQSSRICLPMTRHVEYASKFASPHYAGKLDPPPNGPFDHRDPALLKAGSFDSVPQTANEDWATISRWVEEGRPVYVDGSMLDDAAKLFIVQLRGRFQMEPVPASPYLAQLRPMTH